MSNNKKRIKIECARSFKVMGKLFRPGKRYDLNEREIFAILCLPGIKLFEVSEGDKQVIRITKDNYNKQNIILNKPEQVDNSDNIQKEAEEAAKKAEEEKKQKEAEEAAKKAEEEKKAAEEAEENKQSKENKNKQQNNKNNKK